MPTINQAALVQYISKETAYENDVRCRKQLINAMERNLNRWLIDGVIRTSTAHVMRADIDLKKRDLAAFIARGPQ